MRTTSPLLTGLLLLSVGCAATAATPAATTPAATPAAAAPLDDAAATQRAHEFFAAVDRRDAEAFHALITGGFVLFEDGYVTPADKLSEWWAKSIAEGRPPRARKCEHERLRRSDSAIVYIGGCTEHDPAFKDRAAQDWEGWNTVVMVPDRGAWKVALWYWERSGVEAQRARWNEAYRRGLSYITDPNRLLVQSVAGVTPGAALVVAMGQGRNALYLAEQGWKVTGVDISDEGIRQAKKAAAERGLTLDAVLADMNKYDVGTARWDLVTMLYAGNDKGWIERIKAGIKPGGLFVFEFFAKDPANEGSGTFIGVAAGELAAAFAGWEILRDETVADIADWGKSKAKLVRFVARKP